ncbi:MAG: hypothetical protein EZS28_038988, partial [Streblomastix strix]
TLYMQTVGATVQILPSLVTVSTVATFCLTQDIPQVDFATRIMPNVGFMVQMTRDCTSLNMYMQHCIMIYTSSKRLKAFLLLQEMKNEKRELPNKPDRNAVEIMNGQFRWGEAPEIPKSQGELEETEKRRRIEMKKNQQKLAHDLKERNISPLSSMSPLSDSLSMDVSPLNSPFQSAFSPSVAKTPIPDQNLNHGTLNYTDNYMNQYQRGTNEQDQIGVDKKKRRRATLQDINITLPIGSLTMVIGGIGSGKTSIAASIIGDIERESGEVRIKGSIAYCPQVPWINNNTIRGNIIFGSQF